MKCPDCGIDMTHHADKLVDPVSAEEASQIDSALGGLIEEAHTCPECGRGESRRVS